MYVSVHKIFQLYVLLDNETWDENAIVYHLYIFHIYLEILYNDHVYCDIQYHDDVDLLYTRHGQDKTS